MTKNKIEFNYSKLRGKIKEKFSSEQIFSEEIGLNKATLSNKLNNKNCFTQYEIKHICNKLEIKPSEITQYFFDTKVQ